MGGLDTALAQREAKFRNIGKIEEVPKKITSLRSDVTAEASNATLDNIK